MRELGETLSAAEAATARALPGFDDAVVLRDVASRVRRRRTVRVVGNVLGASASIAAVAVGAVLVFGALEDRVPAVPGPSVAPSPTPTEGTMTPRPDDTPGPVTVADGLPDAHGMTRAVLSGAGRGWTLAIYDSTLRPRGSEPIDGERVLYLVSPSGDRYEAANLTRYQSPHLEAWDVARGLALIVDSRYQVVVVDLATGAAAEEWRFCGEGGSLVGSARGDGRWLLRGFCSGEALDGIYADDGSLVSTDGIVRGGEGVTVIDVGTTQVTYEFEVPPAQAFVAHPAGGGMVAIAPVGADVACYPLGPSADGGVAAQCWLADGSVELWDLDITGGEPQLLADADTLAELDAQSGGAFPAGGASLVGYCRSAGRELVVTSHPAVVWVSETTVEALGNGELHAQACLGGERETFLLAGGGALWSWSAATGETVTLLPAPDPGDDGVRVGSSEGGAILHP